MKIKAGFIAGIALLCVLLSGCTSGQIGPITVPTSIPSVSVPDMPDITQYITVSVPCKKSDDTYVFEAVDGQAYYLSNEIIYANHFAAPDEVCSAITAGKSFSVVYFENPLPPGRLVVLRIALK